MVQFLSFFLPLHLSPRGGRQTGIPVYHVLTKLTPEIKNSEIFPDSFDAIRKDRVGDAHGGVFDKFVAFSREMLCTETPELDTDCEIIWCKLNIIGCRTLYLGSFYRPPNRKPEIEKKYLEAFNSSLT